MSDSNRTKVGWVKEVTPGTTPASPAFKNKRIKSSGLSFTPTTTESQELRDDRMLGDVIRVKNECGGPLALEVSFDSLNDDLENVLQSTWTRFPVRDNNGVADSQITDVTVTTGVYTVLTSAGTEVNTGTYAVGQLVRATGFTNAANNVLARVSAATATSVTLGNTSVAETAPPAAAKLKAVGFRGASADITATATGLASTALNFTTLGLVSGMWVKVGGSAVGEQFATAANNGWARINGTITATALPLDNLPAGWSVDAGTGKTITVWVGDYIRNAATPAYWSLEQQYADLTVPEYDYYVGAVADQLALNLRSNEKIEGTLTMVAMDASNVTARKGGATDIAAAQNDILNSSSNVGNVSEGGTALAGTTAVTAFDLTLSNSVRRRMALGSLGAVSLGFGTFRCKGKLSMYYANNTIRTKILAGTASGLMSRIKDATAPNNLRGYVIDLPRIKYENGNPNVPGIDTDRTIDPEFSAVKSTTFGYMVQFQRFEEFYDA